MLIKTQVDHLIRRLRATPEFVVMDTEQTCWPGSLERRKAGTPLPTDLREIIQIGAVLVETRRFSVVSSFEIVVRPKVNPLLSELCISLTGVTQKRLDEEGVPFADALPRFEAYVGGRPVVVYNADADVFRENAALNLLEADIPDHLRLRGQLEACGVDMTEVNSGRIARRLGSTKTYREHDALADVVSMADGLAILAEASDGLRPLPE